jgi:transposase InsO family protein
MVEFVKEHIIYRFGIPQTITTDQGVQFVSSEFREFAESMGIKLFNSSPYYAQANGQAEAYNKIMIKLIQKKIDQKPKRWHSVLNEALWAYRMAPHGATKTSPYELVYGHHAVLPWEMRSDSRRVVLQKD